MGYWLDIKKQKKTKTKEVGVEGGRSGGEGGSIKGGG